MGALSLVRRGERHRTSRIPCPKVNANSQNWTTPPTRRIQPSN